MFIYVYICSSQKDLKLLTGFIKYYITNRKERKYLKI